MRGLYKGEFKTDLQQILIVILASTFTDGWLKFVNIVELDITLKKS